MPTQTDILRLAVRQSVLGLKPELLLTLRLGWLKCWHRWPLSGTLPSQLGRLLELLSLKLNDNRISGVLPTQLGGLHELEEIDVHGNPLDGDIPSQIGQLINLKRLYVPDEQLLPLPEHPHLLKIISSSAGAQRWGT